MPVLKLPNVMAEAQRTLLKKGTIVAAVCIGLFLLDYFHTRSAPRLGLILARLGVETPLESYKAEFGEPTYHFTEADDMKTWGAPADTAFLTRTEL